MDRFLGFKTEEILTCLLLVVVGYFIAKMFSERCGCNGFSVGNQYKCNLVRSGTNRCGTPLSARYTCPRDTDGKLTQSECDLLTSKLSMEGTFGIPFTSKQVQDYNDGTYDPVGDDGVNVPDCPTWADCPTPAPTPTPTPPTGPPGPAPGPAPTPAPASGPPPTPAPATLSLKECDKILKNPNSDISKVCCDDSVGGCSGGVPLNCTPDCYSKYSVFYNQCKDHYKEGTRATDPDKYKQIFNTNYVCDSSNHPNQMFCKSYDYDNHDLTRNNHFIKLMEACDYPSDIADNPPEWLLDSANPDALISELNTCKNKCSSEQDAENFKQWWGECWYGWAHEQWPDDTKETFEESNNIVGRLSQLSDTC